MNSLFESFHNQQKNVLSMDLNSAIQAMAQQVMGMGMTPEQLVRQKIQNGEMTQEQFNQYAQIANQLTGRNR